MVNSLTCAKVKPSHQIKLPLSVVTPITSNQEVPSIIVSPQLGEEAAMSGLGMLTSHPAAATDSGLRTDDDMEDVKPSAAVKMEVLDDLFGSYGWDESASAVAAAVSAAAVANNPFSSLLSQVTPLTPPPTLTSTATTKGTVKVPLASEASTEGVDTTFSPPPLPTLSLASSLTTDSLRVIIPSPHPGPDTTTTMGGSPVANHTPTTPAAPTTPSSVASSSSSNSKKTVFTAKGTCLHILTRKF